MPAFEARKKRLSLLVTAVCFSLVTGLQGQDCQREGEFCFVVYPDHTYSYQMDDQGRQALVTLLVSQDPETRGSHSWKASFDPHIKGLHAHLSLTPEGETHGHVILSFRSDVLDDAVIILDTGFTRGVHHLWSEASLDTYFSLYHVDPTAKQAPFESSFKTSPTFARISHLDSKRQRVTLHMTFHEEGSREKRTLDLTTRKSLALFRPKRQVDCDCNRRECPLAILQPQSVMFFLLILVFLVSSAAVVACFCIRFMPYSSASR